jgi:ABC-2 type transport system permease protein
MNTQRVLAVLLRHTLGWQRKVDQWIEIIYWPVLDLVLWGVTASWLLKAQESEQAVFTLMAVVTSLVLWQVVWRANHEVGLNFLEEIWNRNVVNLFASPLTLKEWVAGLLLLALVKVAVALLVGTIASYLLYALNVFNYGLLVLPHLLVLVIFGWSIGFVAVALILRFGRHIQHVAWTLCALFTPLSAVYFPVASLPNWLQPVSALIPTSYVFEGIRTVVKTGELQLGGLAIGMTLGMIYFLLALRAFSRAFAYRLEQGLQGMD